MSNDKLIEKNRYDDRAIDILKENTLPPNIFGSSAIPLIYRTPYLYYEKLIRTLIKPNCKVLEIGAGTGLHTKSLLKTGAHVTATDISPNALNVLEMRYANIRSSNNLKTITADIEELPFEKGYFDVVICAGSLSYGEKHKVDNEIRRVLGSFGNYICVDSLNNNPIYRVNRYIKYLCNKRSKMTILNMPTIKRLNSLKSLYNSVDIKYFGCISYLMPILSKILNVKKAASLSDAADNILSVKRSAFKFVICAQT
ncbi:class I SAM-dependent methyltransferase [bacterium]|nr:class I SAM-dependent methyltransferase [bacterium]